ncbi:MAG: LON peptidase substrate-binding domain-containing protein, partial [Anaerolineae bacterium]
MLASLKGLEDQAQGLLARMPEELPILPLRNTVALPFAMIPLAVGIPRSVRLVEDALAGNHLIGLMAMKDPEIEEPLPGQIYEVGTVAYIHRVIRGDDGDLQVIVQGLERIKINVWTATSPYLKARVSLAPDVVDLESVETEALRRTLLQVAREVINLMPNLPKEVALFLEQLENPRHLTYMIAANMRMDMKEMQQLLELDNLNDKMRRLISHLTRERELLSLGQKITEDAQEEMTKQQREYFLRQQLEAIRRELGETDEAVAEAEEYRKKIEAAGLPEEAYKEAMRELKRLEKMPPQAAEYSV